MRDRFTSRPVWRYRILLDPDFVDDSTDNTYGYYTIMGDTTVSLAQMTSQYEEHGAEYPSASLKDGGAATIDDFVRSSWKKRMQKASVEKSFLNRRC